MQDRTESVDSANSEAGVAAPRREFEINTEYGREQRDRQFMSNMVVTTKYTCWNFLPKNLWEQLTKLANAYFLMMGAI